MVMNAEWLEKRFFNFILWGVILQVGSSLLLACRERLFLQVAGSAMWLVGTAILLVGLAHYARAKGLHPAWCVLGLLSLPGLVVIVLVPARRIQ